MFWHSFENHKTITFCAPDIPDFKPPYGKQHCLGPFKIVKSSKRFGAVVEFGAFNELLIEASDIKKM